jgi:hypothetical protein
MFLEPFEGPYLKLERAGYHLLDLHQNIEEFQLSAKAEFVKTDREVNPWQVRLTTPVPPVISLIVGDIAHSLRSALDVMLCDIAVVRDVGLSDMSFPFTIDKATFEDKLKLPKKDAPFLKLGDDIVKMIAAAQPYKDGNPLLRGLHDLNNQDKHRMAVPVLHFASCNVDEGPMLSKMLGKNVSFFGESLLGLYDGDPIPEDIYVNDDPSTTISFNEKLAVVMFPQGYVLTGAIEPTMKDLVNTIFELVDSFRAAVMGT